MPKDNNDFLTGDFVVYPSHGVGKITSLETQHISGYDLKVFVISFVFNVLVAALIVYLGDKLGVGSQLSTAVVVVLGIRIFGNAAAIRRRLFRA